MATFAEIFKSKLAESFGARPGLAMRRFKMGKPHVSAPPSLPRGKLVQQRKMEKKIAREHMMYGEGEEQQKRAMDIAKLKYMQENAERQRSDPEFKGVRRENIEEYNKDPCNNPFSGVKYGTGVSFKSR